MSYLKAILRTSLFKVTSLNSFSIVLKICIGLISSKVLAIFVGPAGIALTGNLKNFITSTEAVATLGIQNGILKSIVENKNNDAELTRIISTVLISLFSIVLVLSAFIFAFASNLNSWLFGEVYEFSNIFRVLALTLPWYVATILLIIIINGFGKFKKVIYINIIGNIIGLIFSVLVIWKFKTFGALLSIIIPPSLLFIVAFYFINQEINFIKKVQLSAFDFTIIKSLSPYILMAFVSSVIGPFVFLSIRNNVIETLGIAQAGFWEAMTRISSYYFMFISTILSVYFLPKLVFANSKKATKNVFYSYFKGIMPLFIVGLIMIYFLRFFIVKLIFTSAFIPVTSLFFWQLLGDVFKGFSLILGYQFFAKKLTIAFLVTEILSLSIMFVLSKYLVGFFQIEGIVIAHAITYFIYLLVLVIYFRKIFFKI